jgi:UDP-glucose 4-epimerase
MAALQYLRGQRQGGMVTVNLGTGRGYSVLEMVRAFEAANGLRIPFRIKARRPGDVPAYFADATRARQLLGWRATRSLHDMCVDSWRWQRDNPDGYTERHCGSPLDACR